MHGVELQSSTTSTTRSSSASAGPTTAWACSRPSAARSDSSAPTLRPMTTSSGAPRADPESGLRAGQGHHARQIGDSIPTPGRTRLPMGRCEVNPANRAPLHGVDTRDIYDPYHNIQAGVSYLKFLSTPVQRHPPRDRRVQRRRERQCHAHRGIPRRTTGNGQLRREVMQPRNSATPAPPEKMNLTFGRKPEGARDGPRASLASARTCCR